MQKTYQPIYLNRDLYIPAYEVKVSGKSLTADVIHDVIEVKYTDTTEKDKFDAFEITINNWDDQEQDFKYTGFRDGKSNPERDELFDPGQEIELWMGYYYPIGYTKAELAPSDRLRLMLRGFITKLAPNFPAGGKPTLKISGPNVLFKLLNKQETHTYPRITKIADQDKKEKVGLKDSEIAQKISDRNKLTYNGKTIHIEFGNNLSTETPHEDVFFQHNQFDILVLLKLAQRNNYELVLRQRETDNGPEQYLYFGPSTDIPPSPDLLLEWGKSLIQFQPTLKTMKQVKTLTLRGWNIQTKKPIKVTVDRTKLKPRIHEDVERLYRIEQGFSDRQEIVVDKPFRSKAEAKKLAEDMLKDLAKKMITAQGSTFGTPGLRAGRKIKIGGIGALFSGTYFVESTTHTINASGYITEFKVRREADEQS